MKWQDLSDYRIKAAMQEESYDGTAWITGQWERGQPLILMLGSKKVRVVCRTIDHHFLGYYNSEMKNRYGAKRKRLASDEQYLFLSQHYRDHLGLPLTIETAEGIVASGLQAKHPSRWSAPATRLRACFGHADPFVRITTWLAIISLGIGVVGLIPPLIGWWIL